MLATTNSERPGAGSTRTADPASGVGERVDPTKRVLLVDDHDLFRQVLGVVLEHHAGFDRSVHAGSLVQAHRALDDYKDSRGGRFDLAVVDLDLPGGGGFALLEELREAAPGVSVMGITKHGDHGQRVRALRAGASEVLTTAASGEEIVAAARRLGG